MNFRILIYKNDIFHRRLPTMQRNTNKHSLIIKIPPSDITPQLTRDAAYKE
jgi:hypothetical protein